MDRHTLAAISIVGSSLDVLGALYLAYDLLGGEHGPLRTLTRGVTYGVLFGAGYGISLGPVFGLASGAAHGITLAWELSRAARHGPAQGRWRDAAMSAIRGCGFGLGAAAIIGPLGGIALGLLSTLGQIAAYRLGVRPDADYAPAARPRITRLQLLSAVNRAVGYAAGGYLSAILGHRSAEALAFGLKAGLAIGLVTAISSSFIPVVEWAADRLPEKRMGVAGVGLILAGFALQSVQYWLTLLDVSVR